MRLKINFEHFFVLTYANELLELHHATENFFLECLLTYLQYTLKMFVIHTYSMS